MENDTNSEVLQGNENEAVETTQKESSSEIASQTEYSPASEVCDDIETVVPAAMAFESKRFNDRLSIVTGGVDDYVMERLHYNDYEQFCQAFAKEQVDAIATAIWNFENTGNGIILADQTGVGKGRVCAGLMRYCVLHLGKVPIFFTEKKHLLQDIYRDLVDIHFDAGVPVKCRVETKKKNQKDYSDEEVIEIIKEDISENEDVRIDFDFNEIEEDFNLNDIFKDEHSELLGEIIELYRQHLLEQGEIDVSFKKNPEYEKCLAEARKEGKIQARPFIPISGYKIKDAEGNILYEMDGKSVSRALKSVLKTGELPEEYRCVVLPYSQIQRPFKKGSETFTDKALAMQKLAVGTIMILDESHNSAGFSSAGEPSNTFKMISAMLRNAKDAVYVSATFAKRPSNMPVYTLKTSISEANLSDNAMISAFNRGGLSLQESTAAELVRIGQLIRREKRIDGNLTEYYWENEDSKIGQEQISKLNRVATLFQTVKDFQSIVKRALKDAKATVIADPEDAGKVKFAGGVGRFSFLLFNFFILGLKIKQTYTEAIQQMRNGRKVVIAIANTMESAFDNLKKTSIVPARNDDGVIVERIKQEKYEIGERMDNDFSKYCEYLLSYTLRYKQTVETVNEKTGEKKKKEYVVDMINPSNEKHKISDFVISAVMPDFKKFLATIQELEVGVPLTPLDIIKERIREEGFSIDEITGRKRVLKLDKEGGASGIITTREIRPTEEVIKDFNENKTDALIINQSGAVGVSMHAKPNEVAHIVRDTPPTSLKNKAEVKQRCMIVTQMELDVNKEVQKLGRINRTGQVYPPLFRYLVSAIPSEKRLTAMMEQKMRSLSSLVTAKQDQFASQFTADDFFGEVAAEPFNETMVEMKQTTRVPLNKEAGKVIKEYTKMVYFLPYEFQKEFYDIFSQKLEAHIKNLKEMGAYTGELSIKDYQAETKRLVPFVIGNNESYSSFGRHSFIDISDVTVFEEKNFEANVKRDIETYLTAKDEKGDTIAFSSIGRYAVYMKEFLDKKIEEKKKINQASIEDLKASIQEDRDAIKALEEEAKKFGELNKAIELHERILAISDEIREKSLKIGEYASEGEIDKMNEVQKEVSDLSAENKKLKQEFEANPHYKELVENRGEQQQIMLQIDRRNEGIEKKNRQIANIEESIKEDVMVKDLALAYVSMIGDQFIINEFEQDKGYDYEIQQNRYKYRHLIYEERAVLTSVRASVGWQDNLTLGKIELRFMTATGNHWTNLSQTDKVISDEQRREGMRHVFEAMSLEKPYTEDWNKYVKSVYTGSRQEKMFVTGSLLKSYAALDSVNIEGGIVKYDTIDNKIRIGVELSKKSREDISRYFNITSDEYSEGNEPLHPVMFDAIPDNYEKLVVEPLLREVEKMYSEDRSGMVGSILRKGYRNEISAPNTTMCRLYAMSENESSDRLSESRIRNMLRVQIASKGLAVIELFMRLAVRSNKGVRGLDYIYNAYRKDKRKKMVESKVNGITIEEASYPLSIYGYYDDMNSNMWLLDVKEIRKFRNSSYRHEMQFPYWMEVSFDTFMKMLEFAQKNRQSFLSVTDNKTVEAAEYYIFEQFADEVADVVEDVDGNGQVRSELTGDVQKDLDTLIDKFVQILS